MSKGNKFGTFGGVFTPSVLTILGVIMYMRLPWIVGQGGLQLALGIILVAHVISVATGLSVASIATDKSVQAGGPYYIISRSLGLPIGGTLGLALCVGLAFSISLYVIGFCESFLSWRGLAVNAHNIRIYGSITLAVITGVTLISTAFAIKTQYLILGAIGLSLLSILAGPFFVVPLGLEARFTSDSVHLNPWPGGASIGVLFGIFFPAVTGFTAGVNMSGDLKDPRRAIPRGTIAAIAVGLITYIALAAFLAVMVPAAQLVSNKEVLLDIALSKEAVLAGIWGATLSSALGSILGAPRILQALSQDRITPRWFARGYGPTNEPRNALVIVFVVALGGILVAELDVIARVVSMFFIATYGFLNLSCAVETWASPDFRPEFKIPNWVPLLGLGTCVLIMTQLDFLAMLGAVTVLAGLFVWLKRRELVLDSGDTWSGVWSSVVRAGLQQLDREPGHARNWRPNVLCFVRPELPHSAGLIALGQALIGHRGVLTEFELTAPGGHDSPAVTPREPRPAPLGRFRRRVETDQPLQTMEAICRFHGFSGVQPNTVLTTYDQYRAAGPAGFGPLLEATRALDFNLLLLGHDPRHRFLDHQRVDIWIHRQDATLPLAIKLLRALTGSDDWHRAEYRFLVTGDTSEITDRLYRATRQLLKRSRMDALVKVVDNTVSPRSLERRIGDESAGASLTLVGLPAPHEELAFLDRQAALLDQIGSVLYLRASRVFERIGPEPRQPQRVPKRQQDAAVDVASQDLPPLALPTAPECKNEVRRFASAHDALFERLYRQHLAVSAETYSTLLSELQVLLERFFVTLGRAVEGPEHPRRQKQVGRAQSTLVFHVQRLIAETAGPGLQRQRAILEHGVEDALSAFASIKAGAPPQVRVDRPTSDYQDAPGDSPALRRLKRRLRLRARLTRGKPAYTIPTEPLMDYLIDLRTAGLLETTLRETALHGYRLLQEIGKLVASVKAALTQTGSRRHLGELNPAFVASERRRVSDTLDQLRAAHADALRQQWQTLRMGARALVQSYADDLDRLDVAAHIRAARRGPRAAAARLERLPQMPAAITQNAALLLGRPALALSVAAFQRRLRVIVGRLRAAVQHALASGTLHDTERVRDTIAALLDRLREGRVEAQHPRAELKAQFSAARIVDELVADIQTALSELPESLGVAPDGVIREMVAEPLDELSDDPLNVRGLVQFLVESQIAGWLQPELEAIPALQARTVGVVHDAVRLIQFNLTDLEPGGPVDPDATAQVVPVVEAALARIEGELSALRGRGPELDERITEQLERVLDQTNALAITGVADAIQSAAFDRGASGVLTQVGERTERLSAAAAALFARLIYNRSATVLRLRRLTETADHGGGVVNRALRLAAATTPKPAVMAALPFYYRQLFLGRSAINQSFWVGRKQELAAAAQAIQDHRAGYRGALLVQGERGAGKSAFCQVVAARHFDRDRVFHVYPPAGGSVDPAVFQARVAHAIQPGATWQAALDTLPDHSAVIIHGLEQWWERSPRGAAVLDLIRATITGGQEPCLWVLNVDRHTAALANQLGALSRLALATITCGPLGAQTLEAIISLRHRSTGLRFELAGRPEAELPVWRRARLFYGHFDYADGNVGTALQSWIVHIDRVEAETLTIRPSDLQSGQVIRELPMALVALLLMLVLHRRLSTARIARLTQIPEATLAGDLATLERMGLVERDPQGLVEIAAWRHHLVVKQLQTRGVL